MQPDEAGRAARLRDPILRAASGELPANVALMHLLIEAATPEEAEAALAGALAGLSGPAAERAGSVAELWRANPGAFGTVKAVLLEVDHGAADGGWAARFDRAARASPDGSAALYALGNPDLLAEATREVVEAMRAWGLLGPGRTVLEIGCGSGRFLAALSPEAGAVAGLDVSSELVAAARARCAGLANVRVMLTEGRDLAGFGDGSQDLVLAADSFPYLVQPDPSLARRHLEEAARVLRPGGSLLILNYSYRGSLERDARELGAEAARLGLAPVQMGERPFRLWDGAAFLLRRGDDAVLSRS